MLSFPKISNPFEYAFYEGINAGCVNVNFLVNAVNIMPFRIYIKGNMI